MKSHLPLALLASPGALATSQSPELSFPQYIFANPTPDTSVTSPPHRIPTSYESAVLGRRILALTPLGTLSTVFPPSSDAITYKDDDQTALETRPEAVANLPIGLMDYIADCEDTGNPTILAIKIATAFRNVRDGSNISLALHWTPPHMPDSRIGGGGASYVREWVPRWLSSPFSSGDEEEEHRHARTKYSAANLPRFSLMGYLEKIPSATDADTDSTLNDSNSAEQSDLAKCFVSTHPDSKYWLPGNRIHTSGFVRLVVTNVYWIGGFGDRAYIGWIPFEEWQNVTREEWEEVRLPGEKKGWGEWTREVFGWEL